MSDASDDEFISALEGEFDDSGFAWWWRLVERIAKQMDATNKCSAEYPIDKWMIFLRIKRKKNLEKFLEFCAKSHKISYEYSGKILKIDCPKLLELRDEYSRKSGQTTSETPDKVAPEEYREERKKEREEKVSKKTTQQPSVDVAARDGCVVEEKSEYSKRYVEAFDVAGRAVFGDQAWTTHRPWPGPRDFTTNGQIEALGSNPEEFRAYCESGLKSFFDQAKPPPATPAYFIPGFKNHLAEIVSAKRAPIVPVDAIVIPTTELTTEDLGGDTPENLGFLKLLNAIKTVQGEAIFQSWFRQLRFHEIDDEILIISAPTRFIAEWVNSKYEADIRCAASLIWPQIKIVIVTADQPLHSTTGKQAHEQQPGNL